MAKSQVVQECFTDNVKTMERWRPHLYASACILAELHVLKVLNESKFRTDKNRYPWIFLCLYYSFNINFLFNITVLHFIEFSCKYHPMNRRWSDFAHANVSQVKRIKSYLTVLQCELCVQPSTSIIHSQRFLFTKELLMEEDRSREIREKCSSRVLFLWI